MRTLADRGVRGVAFWVGSAYGLAPSLVKEADLSLSMSPMTFPHQLAVVMLAEEAQEHPHNLERDAFTNINGFNQPNASPRYTKTKPKVKHNAKKVGVDLDEICNEFNLNINNFI